MIGEVVARRFEIAAVAGRGGMGTVFRACDRETGALVALKVVEGVHANERFLREASLLANLDHEGIVRYVMHGALDGDRMFLAMEWLDGVPLDEHIERGPLPIADVLAIGRRLASALGEAHTRGIVHRDVKPSNVMLRAGRAELATLVDFGIARTGTVSKAMTATGAVIGTPAYMAPEQVRGERAVDARADVFSVGCVLFECLTGRPPFAGEHVIAILAKILLEPAPRLASLRADVPAALDALVARLLEKSPDLRPKDARAIESALATLDASSMPETVAARIGDTERRLATVVLARARKPSALGFAVTEDVYGVTEESLVVRASSEARMSLAALADGTIVGAVLAGDSGAEAAMRAVRCALLLQRELGEASIAVATGRAVVAGDVPVGEAIDVAARLLHHEMRGLFVDEATASLVEPRFEIAREAKGVVIVGERAHVRTVMGKEVPCFGRERELGLLEAMFAECVDEPISRVALVVAPPGIGKSRLQRELVGRLARRSEPPRFWVGLVDPLMQGAAHALAGDLFRRVLDLAEGIPAPERRSRLRARLAKVPDADRIGWFLGEIVDAPAEEDNELVRAARQNPSVMATQIQSAAADFVAHELTRGPLLLVLEDVHWADAASLRLVNAVIKRAKDLPLFVVALARPSIDEVHPKLWEEHRCHRIVLDPLLRKAAEKLARAVLGEDADVDALVQRAQGNALFVEELARARAKGTTSELPLTIAAAAESRFTSLAAEARQALRAAAIFGERFWRGAVAHLVGPRVAALLDTHLDAIEEAELASRTQPSRFAGEREYLFRHALVRDAAYAMLTDADRTLGHSLAGEWLASRVDDAALLAQHYESGECKEKAASFYVRAAEQALAADEIETVLAHASRAETLGAAGELLGRVRLMQADAELGRMNNVEALARAKDVLALLPRGAEGWFEAIGIGCAASGKLGEIDVLFRLVDLLESEPARGDVTGRARAIARVRAAIQLSWCGALERARALLDTCTQEPGAAGDLALEAWRLDAAFELAFASGETMHPSECRRAQELYARIGDRRGVLTQAGNEVITLLSIGSFDEASARVEETLRTIEGGGVPVSLAYAKAMSEAWRAASVRQDYDLLIRLTESAWAKASPRSLSANKIWLAMMILPSGRDAQAKALVEDVCDLAEKSPPFLAVAYAILARVAQNAGDLDEALSLVLRAVETAKRGVVIWGATFVDLAHVDLLELHGRTEEAKRALEGAFARLQRRVENLGELAPTYLAHGSHVAELLARRQSG